MRRGHSKLFRSCFATSNASSLSVRLLKAEKRKEVEAKLAQEEQIKQDRSLLGWIGQVGLLLAGAGSWEYYAGSHVQGEACQESNGAAAAGGGCLWGLGPHDFRVSQMSCELASELLVSNPDLD